MAQSDLYQVKWKTVESNRVDTKKLKADYPEVYKECINTSKSRRFTVKGIA